MRKWLTILLLGTALTGARAQWITPPAVGGALFGTVFGGLAGGNCQNGGFSGTGAAIGAGVGFVAGALLGQLQQASAQPVYYAPAMTYAQPGYGYVTAPAPAGTYAPAPVTVSPPVAPARLTYQWSAPPPSPRVQIPDAPRVPDAPSF